MKKLKFLFLPIAFCLVVANTSAQKADTKKEEKTKEHLPSLKIISAYYGDSVVLRWAPTSWPVWLAGVDGGYVIERYDIDLPADYLTQKDSAKKKSPQLNSKSKKLLTNAPLKPISEAEWKKIFDTGDTLSAMAAHLIYSKRKDVVPTKGVNKDDLLKAYDEQQNLHTLVLLTADRSAKLAKGMALSFIDKGIEKNKGYLYKVYIHGENPAIKYDSAGTFIHTFKVNPLPEIPKMSAEEGEHHISLSWSRLKSSTSFTSYIVERSDDGGKSFTTQTKPIFTPTINEKEDVIRWENNIPENYKKYIYKVTGITPFGIKGKPSLMQCIGRDRTPPSIAEKVIAEHISGTKVKITWEKSQKEGDFAGYFIGKGKKTNGPFTPVSHDRLPTSATTYIDDSASVNGLNYYVVAVVDTAGNAKPSGSAYAIMKDNTPPAKPIGLKARIDTMGVVQLTWKIGSEKDLEGYLVYFANDSSHTFTPISKEIVPINAFKDSVTLNTLTKKIYYKVAAMDSHKNISSLSDFISVKRPDIIAPVQPVFSDFKVTDTTITIFWNCSSSNDVVDQILYRKEGEKPWEILKHLDKSIKSYADYSVAVKTEYQYALAAVDDAGNVSGKSYPIKGRAFGKTIVLSEPPNLNFSDTEHKINIAWKSNVFMGKMLVYRNFNNMGLVLYQNADAKEGVVADVNPAPGIYQYALQLQSANGVVSKLSPLASITIK